MVLSALCVLMTSMVSGSADTSCASGPSACCQKACDAGSACGSSVNGRVFSGTVIVGPRDTGKTCPDAARYGAQDRAGDSIRVRVPGLFGFESCGRSFEISPWQPVTLPTNGNNWSNPYKTAHRKLASRVEAARQQWLKDNNFVGGVRTFVNDAAAASKSTAPGEKSPQAKAGGDRIEPRAVIELPADMPRIRSKVRVLAPGESPVRKATVATKVLPREAPAPAQVAMVKAPKS